MRWATIRTADGTHAARVEGDTAVPLRAPDVADLLRGGLDGPGAKEAGEPVALVDADLAPAVTTPEKILCVGLNYRDHILETGRELPTHPTLFTKFRDSLLGPRDDLVLPSVSETVDWEGELGVVIGSRLWRATPDEARAAIAGYTVVNDISMRDWQRRTLQWMQGKAFYRASPVGPVLVSPDEIGHADDLTLCTELDGEVVQEAQTSQLVFSPSDVAAYISQFVPLGPGDLIATGTPGGVGEARTPSRFLRPGDVLTTSIEGIGSLVNRCVAEG